MEMIKVESSNVLAIGHDGKENLHVIYKGDSLYDFDKISVEDFDKLQKSQSVGGQLHRMGVRGTRMNTQECPECKRPLMIFIEPECCGGVDDHYQCQGCGHLKTS